MHRIHHNAEVLSEMMNNMLSYKNVKQEREGAEKKIRKKDEILTLTKGVRNGIMAVMLVTIAVAIVFTNLLKGSGLYIDTAQSGQDCLSKTEKHRYDIIFMDHMMPVMDGIETFGKMKEQRDGLNGNTPVIMLTANAIIGMKETYLEEGFSGYLSKPIDRDELISTLRKFLPDEKIIHSDGGSDGAAENEGEMTGTEKFKELTAAFPDIDIHKGLAYCSDNEEFYTELLKDFAAPAKREELQKAYDENDMKLYAVKIHAIKGSARTLGLVRLGEIAEGLQFAAEKEETDYIAAHHAEAAEELKKLEKCMEQL